MKDNQKQAEEQLHDFPSFRMSESTQDHLHQQLMNSLKDAEMQSKRNRMLMNKVRIGLLTAAALLIFSILSVNLLNTNFNSGNEENPVPIDQEVEPEDDSEVDSEIVPQPDDSANENLFNPVQLEQQANEILQAIHNRDMDVLASHVHPEESLLMSPYYSVMDHTVRFEKDDIAALMEDTTEYLWGYGEANTEIRLTPSAYWENHLQVERFFTPDEVFVDQQNEQVETGNYLQTVFPDAKIVEYYHAGTEQYSNLDWRSLSLVFEQAANNEWKLVAIINNLFTP
ncbi:hypothetical protein ACFO0S_11300 [Chryseomicrobium palamuruense]|uniref:Uncharacterized protein n=1 Tax=Chryseomicrobium palamuruense TaxID=682973 RepID=A0ABV8UYP4_9BACL